MNEEELLKAVGFESIDAFEDIAVENPRELLKRFGEYASAKQSEISNRRSPTDSDESKESVPVPSVETSEGWKSVSSQISELSKRLDAKSMISDAQVRGGAGEVEVGDRQGFGKSKPVSVIEKLLAHNKREFKESDVFSSGV